jgi:hypothetical protein
MQGNVTTWIVVDREGKVRDIGTMVSENAAMEDTGKVAVASLRFKPFVVNGVPAQVMSQITTPFKTTRPAGTEAFDSAETFFERGRKLGFPSGGTGKPYVLRAEFQVRGKSGYVETGNYEDTWLSDTQWRREAWFEDGHCGRSRDGEKRYRLVEGGQAHLVQMILKIMEPIPAIDTFTESDWRIKRDTVNGVRTIRLAAGPESPDGKLDPAHSRGYWFDDAGLLVKAFYGGIESQRSDFQDFNGVKIAHQIDVLTDGMLAMRIRVTALQSGVTAPGTFVLKGHEWERQFTDEVR